MERFESVSSMDEAARDATLASLLQQRPSALITAIDGDGLFTDLPASIELHGQRVVDARSGLDLVAPGSRAVVIEKWEAVKRLGAAVGSVVLVNGAEASFYFADVRHSHGVYIGLIVSESAEDLVADLARRPPVLPRTGRVDKDELAVIRHVDHRICEILGFRADELLGRNSLEFIHPDDQVEAVDAWMEMLTAPGESTRIRLRHRRADDTWLWMEFTNTNLLKQREHSVVSEMLNISDEMRVVETLRQREQLLSRLAEALPSGVLHVDRDRNVVYANVRLGHLFGTGRCSSLEQQFVSVIPDDRIALEAAIDGVLLDGVDDDIEVHLRMIGHSDLTLCAIAIRVLTDADDTPIGAVLCVDDITAAAELRANLERRATIDQLTGCLNRAAVLDQLDRTLTCHQAGSPGTAVVFLDLDGLKEVNDTFGHHAGDQLLAGAADRLRSAMRDKDVIGRLGGDEFVVVLPGVDGLDEATHIGMRLVGALMDPLEITGGMPMRIRSSIGVAWASTVGITADVITAAADQAMYESKRTGTSEPVFITVQ